MAGSIFWFEVFPFTQFFYLLEVIHDRRLMLPSHAMKQKRKMVVRLFKITSVSQVIYPYFTYQSPTHSLSVPFLMFIACLVFFFFFCNIALMPPIFFFVHIFKLLKEKERKKFLFINYCCYIELYSRNRCALFRLRMRVLQARLFQIKEQKDK